MMPGKSLKHYVSYFQSLMVLVYNCNDNLAATVFVTGLQVTHSYKHLVKYEVTKMRDILSRVQKYIQIEDATRSAIARSSKREIKGRSRSHNLSSQRRLKIELLTQSANDLCGTLSSLTERKLTLLRSKSPWTMSSTPSRIKTG